MIKWMKRHKGWTGLFATGVVIGIAYGYNDPVYGALTATGAMIGYKIMWIAVEWVLGAVDLVRPSRSKWFWQKDDKEHKHGQT